MNRDYQICSRCVLDTWDTSIEFDENGVCNYCHRAERALRERTVSGEAGLRMFERQVEEVKQHGEGKEYDSILGISGGTDSSYLAVKVVEAGLRPLAVHFDSGWNSEGAVHNIERLVKGLGIDLFTLVCDWREMKDLQRSYFRASVINCDVPQDHAFVAVLWKLAADNGIKHIFSGHNVATESYLPVSFRGYSSRDWKNIKAIQKRFGTRKLKAFPHVTYRRSQYYKYVKKFRVFNSLNYLDYDKSKATAELRDRFQLVQYKGKHGESYFTKFFQGHYLPTKFGIDKRRAHLASLINSAQMTREEALEELSRPFYDNPSELRQDKEFVLKKLGICEAEWVEIMGAPEVDATAYPSNNRLYLTEQWGMARAAKIAKLVLPGSFTKKLQRKLREKFSH
ncbi:N-acetyl sugar amidotransferase [Akkermansiaceae bacterium]|nr:N-acetyl sugar amidotransferase [Akkermansiaceae bacterium]